MYAARHWSDHIAKLGDAGVQSPDLQGKIFLLFEEQNVYVNWLYAFQQSDAFKRDHEYWLMNHAESEPPIYQASVMGLTSVIQRLLARGHDPFSRHLESHSFHSTFQVAAAKGGLDVFKLVMEKALSDFRILENNATSYALGLDLSTVFQTSMWRHRSKGQIPVFHEYFVIHVARNERSGLQLLDFLLDWQNATVHITEDVLDVMTRNTGCGHGMMQLISDKKWDEFQITLSLMEVIALYSADNPGVSYFVLQNYGTDIPLNDNIAEKFVTYGPREVIEHLWQLRGDEILITGKLLIASLVFYSSGRFDFLWTKRTPGTEISPDILPYIAERSFNLGAMTHFFEELRSSGS